MPRNPRITKTQARAMKAVLRAHGYLKGKKRKATKRKARKTVRRHVRRSRR
jgi:uncharacterized C2H2 Zn-finger protein